MEPVLDMQQSAYLALHPEAKEILEKHPPKEGDGPACDESISLNDAPIIPPYFDLWVDVNMSLKLKTKNHPEGEWVTLWCDSEPTPSPSEGRYFIWSWWKSSWNQCKKALTDHGIPILESNHYYFAPCDISIPYDYVVEDPYRS